MSLFRRRFGLAEKPESLRIAVSADNRYVLWLNGVRVGRGPLKGTLESYQVETYELAPWLRAGENILAAEVRWGGEHTAMSEVHSAWPGWWVQGLDTDEWDTPGAWRVLADDSVLPNDEDPFVRARSFLGPLDRVDAARRPAGWREVEFDDRNWMAAVAAGPQTGSEGWGLAPLRRLVARELPALAEESREFARVWHQRSSVRLPWSLAAGQGGEIWLDAGAMTTSYPEIMFAGGAGRIVRLVYAEALGNWLAGENGSTWDKTGPRGDVASGVPHGYHDRLVLPGGRHGFEPFHWRTFWFLKIEILPGPEPVEVVAATHRFTTFPHAVKATFTCDQPEVDRLWETSLRTLRLCAHETFEDCPYHEQLNYVADARLQALCTQYLANDTRLARRGLELFRDSLGPDGLVSGRAPSRRRQSIPGFSLQWILMLHDHWEWCGRPSAGFIRSCLGAVDAVLNHFRARLTPAGFVGVVDDWAWVDLMRAWPQGVPPAVKAGTGSTYFTALFACALEAAARLHREAGVPGDAVRWTGMAVRLREAIQTEAWSETAGLFLEGPGRPDDAPSQHTQAMVLLAGAADTRQVQMTGERLASDDTLLPMSLFHRFYLARALEAAGRYEVFFPRVLAPWRQMMADGVGTWLESADPTRSDCHGWSSWMIHDFFACILGVRPGGPGWTSIRIQPQVAATSAAAGTLQVPTGTVKVRWSTAGAAGFELHAETPAGVPVTIVLPDGRVLDFPDGGNIAIGGATPAWCDTAVAPRT